MQLKDEEVPRSSNLLNMLLRGFAIRIKAEISQRAVPFIRRMIWKALKPLIEKLKEQNNKLAIFLLAGIKAFHLRLKFQLGEAEQFLEALLADSGFVFPDVVDLIDALGFGLSGGSLLAAYDNMPFVRYFIDTLKEVGVAKVEFGITQHLFTAAFQVQTSGIRELFDMVLKGMQG